MKILFVDDGYPHPYDERSLSTEGLGGTEASLIRVAEALGGRGYQVAVHHHFRDDDRVGQSNADYLSNAGAATHPVANTPDVIVVEKWYRLLPELRRRHPRAALVVWLHALPVATASADLAPALAANATLVTVSEFHRQRLLSFWPSASKSRWPEVVPIHEPVGDDLAPDGTEVDPDQLVFLGSPHKGLEQVLAVFSELRRHRPTARLLLARPAYSKPSGPPPPGVEKLGIRPHPEVLELLRRSFCLFYPQAVFEETFGLVFAEANSVGTPVLTHPHGAAPEVLDSNQLVDCREPERPVAKLLDWYARGRPKVTGKNAYRLSYVIDQWEALFRRAV